jgi:hypothetical protein
MFACGANSLTLAKMLAFPFKLVACPIFVRRVSRNDNFPFTL